MLPKWLTKADQTRLNPPKRALVAYTGVTMVLTSLARRSEAVKKAQNRSSVWRSFSRGTVAGNVGQGIPPGPSAYASGLEVI